MKKTIVGLLLPFALILTACSQNAAPGTPAPGATAPAQTETPLDIQLPMRDATDEFRKITLAAGESVTTPAFYFLDVATGKAEGWSSVQEDVNLSDTPEGRYIRASREPGENFLIDRVSGKAWGWERGKLQFVASHGNRLLFQKATGMNAEPQLSLTLPEFYITNEALQPLVHITLQDQAVVGAQAAFRPDGQSLAIMTTPLQPQGSLKQARLYLVDVKTGKGRLIMDAQEPPQQVQEFRGIHLGTVQGGQAIQIAAESIITKGPGQWDNRQSIRRFNWDGQQLVEADLPNGSFSPDGKLVAHNYEALNGVLDSVEVVDAATGQPRLRILGATSNGWLGDGSGILLHTIEGTKTVDLAGVLKDHPLSNQVREMPALLYTTPDPALFLAGERTVLDATGRVQAELKLGKATQGYGWRIFSQGFGATAKELRLHVYVNHGGDGRDGVWISMPPRVEKPPYAALPLQVKAEQNDCLNLRMEPAKDGRMIRCLPKGTKMAVAGPMALGGHDYGSVTYAQDGSGIWLLVRTDKDEHGWVSMGTKAVAWAD